MLIGSMFEQLACCIHIFVFFLLKKLLFFKLNRSSTDSFLSSPLDFLSRQKLAQFRSIELSGICLDSFSIHRDLWVSSRQNLDNFFNPSSQNSLLFICSIDAQSIELFVLPSTDPQQHLDRFLSIKLSSSGLDRILNSFSFHQEFFLCSLPS